MRVVIDTNVLVSGLMFPESHPGKILRLAAQGRVTPLSSRETLAEIRRVLRVKMKYSQADAQQAVDAFQTMGEIVSTTAFIDIIKEDPSDNKILECAYDGAADALVTGDRKHIRRLRHFHHIPIFLPVEFLRAYFSPF